MLTSLETPADLASPAHASRKAFLQVSGWLLLAGIFFYVLPAPPEIKRGLDESWKAFLSYAFLNGKQFGTEVVFTYGPWGFLINPRSLPGIFPWVVVGRLVLLLGSSAGLALLGVRWIQRPVPRFIWALVILLTSEPTYLLTPLLFLLLWRGPREHSTWERLSLHSVAMAAGLAANTKFTCFILLSLLVAAILPRREGRRLAITAAISSLGFWTLAGQPLSALPVFLSNSAALAAGYNAAMSTWTVSGAAIWGALLLCGLPAVTVLMAELRRPSISSTPLCAWFLLFEAIVVQQSIIRSDRFHLIMGLLSVALPLAITLLPCPHLWLPWPSYRIRYQTLFGVAVLFAGSYVYLSVAAPASPRSSQPASSGRLITDWSSIRRPSATAPATVPSETVDVFPWDLSFALQKGYPVSNLPVIQSYAAFSPGLTGLNSRFLESDRAPSRIYFEIAPIDHRYPTLEDPLAWRSLLTHYEPAAFEDDFLVLHRRVRPRRFTSSVVLSRKARAGEVIPIPSQLYPLIWAEVRTVPDRGSSLLTRLLPGQRLILNVKTAAREDSFLFLEGVAGVGFLLSPCIYNAHAMSALYNGSSPAEPPELIQSVRFDHPGIASDYLSPEIDIRLFALSTSSQQISHSNKQEGWRAEGASQ